MESSKNNISNSSVISRPSSSKPRKKIIWIIVALLIIILIFIILLLKSGIFSQDTLEKKLKNCLSTSNKNYDINYYLCMAVALRDPSQCLDEGGKVVESCLGWVYTSQALDKNDTSICDKITFKTKGFCQAIFTKDESICNTAGNEKEPCLRMVRGAAAGLSKEKIEGICETGPTQESTGVYCRSMLSGDETVCAKAQNIGCYISYYTRMAIDKKDPSYCDKITASVEEIENCKKQVP